LCVAGGKEHIEQEDKENRFCHTGVGFSI
jgi:hypothetical protein